MNEKEGLSPILGNAWLLTSSVEWYITSSYLVFFSYIIKNLLVVKIFWKYKCVSRLLPMVPDISRSPVQSDNGMCFSCAGSLGGSLKTGYNNELLIVYNTIDSLNSFLCTSRSLYFHRQPQAYRVREGFTKMDGFILFSCLNKMLKLRQNSYNCSACFGNLLWLQF